jgi:hypothetical protein
MRLLAESTPVVEWGKLGEVVLYSLAAGVGVALCFALAILGATRFADMRRADHTGGAIGYALLAALGLAATLGAVVMAIVVMTTKA